MSSPHAVRCLGDIRAIEHRLCRLISGMGWDGLGMRCWSVRDARRMIAHDVINEKLSKVENMINSSKSCSKKMVKDLVNRNEEK